jgi:hypothetical protein
VWLADVEAGMPNDAASKALTHAPRVPDAAALNRIIAAVSKTPAGKKRALNLNLDRHQLVTDLLDARAKWLTATALDSDKGARARKKLFSAVAGTAKRFKKCLLDETGQRYAARAIASRFSSDFDAFLAGLDRIIKAAEALTEENNHGGWVRLSRSPRDWFAVEILPPIYERNFGRKAGTSRIDSSKPNANTADGPFIRFAVAVMCQMGIQISGETVARALKDVALDRKGVRGSERAGRKPRQPRKTTLQRPPGW